MITLHQITLYLYKYEILYYYLNIYYNTKPSSIHIIVRLLMIFNIKAKRQRELSSNQFSL